MLPERGKLAGIEIMLQLFQRAINKVCYCMHAGINAPARTVCRFVCPAVPTESICFFKKKNAVSFLCQSQGGQKPGNPASYYDYIIIKHMKPPINYLY